MFQLCRMRHNDAVTIVTAVVYFLYTSQRYTSQLRVAVATSKILTSVQHLLQTMPMVGRTAEPCNFPFQLILALSCHVYKCPAGLQSVIYGPVCCCSYMREGTSLCTSPDPKLYNTYTYSKIRTIDYASETTKFGWGRFYTSVSQWGWNTFGVFFTFSSCFVDSPRDHNSQRILTYDDSKDVIWRKDVPFWGCLANNFFKVEFPKTPPKKLKISAKTLNVYSLFNW